VRYEDRLVIATPENVDLEVSLAGLGSRFAAALIDNIIRLAVMFALFFLVTYMVSPGPDELAGLALAAFFIGSFVIFFGYDVIFETLASGRTPGKKLTGLRVVRVGGRPVGFVSSAVRNLVRIADLLPAGYAIGVISILATEKNQRLGDLAAGTIVIRERIDESVASWIPYQSDLPPDALAWDVSSITPDELATVRSFLGRRQSLLPEARERIGRDLAVRLHPKVSGAPAQIVPERFLEILSTLKSSRA
jgi:uncharacterized RDD family membrane protein YckC